jgi:hypothetical protein
MKRFRIPEIVLGFLLATVCFAFLKLAQVQIGLQNIKQMMTHGAITNCVREIIGICFVTPLPMQQPIFGFAQFVTAFALLMLVYTVSDVRYRFRILSAPIPLVGLTYISSGLIGFGTLLNSVWFAEGWPIPDFLSSQELWQTTFATIFFLVAMTWIWYAFIQPPIFTKRNCVNFARTLYSYILKGSDNELPIIAGELTRSSESIVMLGYEYLQTRPDNDAPKKQSGPNRRDVSRLARDVMLLIGSRKFCRHVVATSPVTAIAFFESMTEHNIYNRSLCQFGRNISTEALINKDSILYHEDQGYYSGLLGYIRPFSKAIYGNYDLVEALAFNGNSPLDIDLKVRWLWDAEQVEAYSRAVLLTLEGYISSKAWHQHSYAIYRALGIIKHSCRDLYKLNNATDYFETDIYRRLEVAVDFVKSVLDRLDKIGDQKTTLRKRGEKRPFDIDFYDDIADLMFDIILAASTVKGPPWTCWSIQHNAVWYNFFGIHKGPARRIVQFKLRRLLYDEICRLKNSPNFKSSRILGFCLNVMGLKLGKKDGMGIEYYSLHRAVLKWTKNNYMRLRMTHPNVATSCLSGNISFEEGAGRLVKTYAKNLNLEEPKDYFELDRPA